MVTIIDLSGNNGPADWHRLRQAGIAGVMLKATEGVTWNDPTFHERRKNATFAGLYVGSYHYARPDHNTGKAEADHFCKVVGELGTHDLLPALDLEAPGTAKPALFDWIVEFNQEAQRRLGRWPLFYSYPAFIAELRLPRPVGSGLWLASYGRDDGVDHGATTPPPWKRWLLHQFSSRCTVGGVDGLVDLSHAPSLNAILAHPVHAGL